MMCAIAKLSTNCSVQLAQEGPGSACVDLMVSRVTIDLKNDSKLHLDGDADSCCSTQGLGGSSSSAAASSPRPGSTPVAIPAATSPRDAGAAAASLVSNLKSSSLAHQDHDHGPRIACAFDAQKWPSSFSLPPSCEVLLSGMLPVRRGQRSRVPQLAAALCPKVTRSIVEDGVVQGI